MNRHVVDEHRVVAELASYQTAKLAARRERGHWRKYSLDSLLEMASDEFVELADAIEELKQARTLEERVRCAERVKLEAADAANYLAFIVANADVGLPR